MFCVAPSGLRGIVGDPVSNTVVDVGGVGVLVSAGPVKMAL